MRVKLCPGCKKEIEYRAKLCWDCFQATKKKTYCVDCGQKIRANQERCRECHNKRIAVQVRNCADCGVTLPRYGNGLRCKSCQIKNMVSSAKQWTCVDCGVSVNRKVKRCVECAHLSRVGRSTYQRTEGHKKQLSERQKGRIPVWRLGKPHNPETRRKMREYWTDDKREAARQKWQGENNPGYIHGQHPRPWPGEFNVRLRTQIRKRDGYICQECSKQLSLRSRMAHVHHIDYNKHNNDPLNLVTLCRSCHAKTNFNRPQWQAHFEQLQAQKAHNGFPLA